MKYKRTNNKSIISNISLTLITTTMVILSLPMMTQASNFKYIDSSNVPTMQDFIRKESNNKYLHFETPPQHKQYKTDFMNKLYDTNKNGILMNSPAVENKNDEIKYGFDGFFDRVVNMKRGLPLLANKFTRNAGRPRRDPAILPRKRDMDMDLGKLLFFIEMHC